MAAAETKDQEPAVPSTTDQKAASHGLTLGNTCQMPKCQSAALHRAKRALGLCAKHSGDRDAMILQASKGGALTVDGKRVTLKEYLEGLEIQDPQGFLSHLEEFSLKHLGGRFEGELLTQGFFWILDTKPCCCILIVFPCSTC